MFGFLTSRWQGPGAAAEKTRPGWFDRRCSPILLSVAKKACTHPIHTIVTITALASYSYLGVLDTGLLDRTDKAPGRVDLETLLAGSMRLRLGSETSWKWEAERVQDGRTATQELALVTLVFPGSSDMQSAPSQLAIPGNLSANLLPSSSSSFSTMSHDVSLAYSVPYAETADFLMAMQEIPVPEDAAETHASTEDGAVERKKWIMKAAKSGNAPGGLRSWARESWISFVDLLKVRCSLLHLSPYGQG